MTRVSGPVGVGVEEVALMIAGAGGTSGVGSVDERLSLHNLARLSGINTTGFQQPPPIEITTVRTQRAPR